MNKTIDSDYIYIYILYLVLIEAAFASFAKSFVLDASKIESKVSPLTLLYLYTGLLLLASMLFVSYSAMVLSSSSRFFFVQTKYIEI